MRRRMPARRRSDGTWRQLPTDYELRLPDECWREVRPVAGSAIARDDSTYAPRLDDAPLHDDEFDGPLTDDDCLTLTVRGNVRMPVDRAQSWDVAGFDDSTIPGDEVSAEVLAVQIVDAASIAIERVPDERRYLATTCILELKKRVRQVALTICQQGLTAARGVGVVRQWVEKALGNPGQTIHSAAHALNILRKFIVGADKASHDAYDAGRARGLARHKARIEAPTRSEYGSSGIRINRVCPVSAIE